MIKPKIVNEVLKSWVNLNDELQTCDEESAISLLNQEKKGRARKQFMLRIHSRVNKLRAERERTELKAIAK